MKKKISILGCGWLGIALGQELVKKTSIVKGSTRNIGNINKIESFGMQGVILDISSIQNSSQHFFNSEVIVITITSKSISSFKKLIQCIEKSPAKEVLFISSTSVYEPNKEIITEHSKTNNSVLNQIEQLFLSSRKFKTTILRFGGLFNEQRKPGNFIKAPYIIKNPEGYINLIHRDDCIQLIIQIIKQKKWNEIFNACASDHPKRKHFYSKEVLKVQGFIPTLDQSSKNDYKIISNKKIKKALNYEFKHDKLLS